MQILWNYALYGVLRISLQGAIQELGFTGLSFQRYYFSTQFLLNFSQRETDKTLITLTKICIQQHKVHVNYNTGMCFEQAKSKQWILTNKNISSYLGKIITTCVRALVTINWTKCISQQA